MIDKRKGPDGGLDELGEARQRIAELTCQRNELIFILAAIIFFAWLLG